MNFRALLALIAGVILFSGVASAQPVTTHSSKTTSELKLCDMTVDEIKQLLGNYKTDYTSDDLTGWLNSGSFDDGQAEWDQINAATGAANKYGYNKNNKNLSNPKKMCLAAVLTSRVKFDDGKAKDFATALYGRYGDLKNASFGADKFATLIKTNDPTSDKVSKKKAASVVQMFFSGTKNVNTRLLKPVFFKDDSDIVDANAARSYVIDMARNTTTENFTSVMEKSSSSGAPSPDLGNISPMSDDLRDGWIKNWEVECTRTDLSYKGNQEDCKQMILEGQYNNIAFFNHVKGYDGQNINQLKIYVDAASSVKKQAKDVDKVEKENNFNVDNHKYNNLKDADDANKKVEDNKIALKKGQDSVDYMKNYLVTLFNGSICFNATIGSVNPNVDKNLKDKLADLSAKLSMEDTFGEKDANGLYSKPFIFRESGSSLAPAPVIDRIKTACILFNRIKNVNITDANKDYDKLAKSVVALFGVDDETQKTNVELALAYALRNENDADIIKQLDALKGVTIYQKGTTDEQKEVINELIIDHYSR